jgi:hypothetical protein
VDHVEDRISGFEDKVDGLEHSNDKEKTGNYEDLHMSQGHRKRRGSAH